MIYRIEIGGFVAYCGDNFMKLLNQKVLEYVKEYNTDMSAQLHRNMDEDIVRHSSEEETGEAEDKEPQI